MVSNLLSAQNDIVKTKEISINEVIQILKEFVEEVEQFQQFTQFYDPDDTTYLVEVVVPNFEPDTFKPLYTFEKFYNADFEIIQRFESGKLMMKVENGHYIDEFNGRNYSIQTIPKKVYFKDGATDTVRIKEMPINYRFFEFTPYSKLIDSIQCELIFNYVIQFDSVIIDLAHPFKKMDDNFVKLIKLDGNNVQFICNNDINCHNVEILNKDGAALEVESNSSIDYASPSYDYFYELRDTTKLIIEQAERDTLLSIEEFKIKYLGRIEKAYAKIPKSDTLLYRGRFKGDAHQVKFWIVKGMRKKSKNITLRNTAVANYFFDNRKNK